MQQPPPIRDFEGFKVLEKAMRQLKLKDVYKLVVVTSDPQGENAEYHLQWNGQEYTSQYYMSHDNPPQESTTRYNFFLLERKDDHFKLIKMVNVSNQKQVVLYEEPKNPNQLKHLHIGDLGYIELKYAPLTSASYPGECVICSEKIHAGGFCRVNCQAGHVFHCDCINQWRNTPQVNPYFEHDWQDNCPLCRGPIDKIVSITMPKKLMSFGMSSDIEYCKRLISKKNNVVMNLQSYLKEHRRLIQLLKSAHQPKFTKEANRQIKEVKNTIKF